MKNEKLCRRIDKRIWMSLHKAEFREITPSCRLKVESWFETMLWEKVWLNVQFEMVDQLEEEVYK